MARRVPTSESGGSPDRDLALADAPGRVVERLLDVLRLQVREGVNDVGGRHAVSDHVDDGGHGDAETSNARESAHLRGVCNDSLELHGALVSMAVVRP